MKDWNEFTQAMSSADFWGLKGSNGAAAALDGDDLTVSGYNKRDTYNRTSPKFNLVRRELIHRTTLGKPFDLGLKLSGTRQGCYVITGNKRN
jgi:hypothetical protein